MQFLKYGSNINNLIMIKNSNCIKLKISVMIFALVFILNHSGFSQGLIISSGAKLIADNASIVLKGDLLNDGSFTNNTSTVVFAGITQSLEGTSGVDFNNLTIMTGSTTTISTAGQSLKGILLCNGALNANNFITLLSTSAQTALIDGSGIGQVNGDVTIQRYFSSGFGYKYFSSPFQASTVSEFSDDINLNAASTAFYKYDENRTSSGWVNYKVATNILIPLQGYAINFGSIQTPNTVDVSGIVNNGYLTRTLYNNNRVSTKGFNLLGNPYPSPIDWYASSGWTKTNIDDALYFFKASTTDQYGGHYSTFIKGVSSDELASNIIPTMQGFFVHVTDGTYPVTGTLQVNNNARVKNQSQSFIKGEQDKSDLRLSASFSSNLSSPDLCVVYFDPKATTNEFDGQLDALKLMNTDLSVPNVYIVTPGGTKISIKALPYATDNVYTVPLGLKINKPGDIIFRINDMAGTFLGMRVSLLDKLTGTVQDLLNNQEYKISLGIGEYLNRFYLNLSNSITEIPVNFTEPDLFSIYYSKGVLKVNISSLQGGEGSLVLINLLGQTLFTNEVYGEGYHEFIISLQDGIYIATYISGTKKSSKKIFIQD
jgi:hypothetical protein